MLRRVLERHRLGKKSERREIIMEFAEEAEKLASSDLGKAYDRLSGATKLYHDLLYGYDSKIDKEFSRIFDYIARRF